MSQYAILNTAAIAWFFIAWFGYAWFAKYKAKRGLNLSSALNHQRLQWMEQVIEREHRIMDATLVANLERNTSFLASTSILVLAGLLTALGIVGNIADMLESLPFYQPRENSLLWLHLKLLILVVIYVYAFFALTWSLRQYGFASVMIGSAPSPAKAMEYPELKAKYMYASSKVIDMAGHSYNYGLRAYYFSLAVLPWFISPWLFMASTSLVIAVLYTREFHSRPFKIIRDYIAYCEAHVSCDEHAKQRN